MEQNFLLSQSPRKPAARKTLAVLGLLALLGTVAAVAYFSSSPRISALSTVFIELEELEFQDYMRKFNKEYESEIEYQARFKVYRDNAAYIRVFNSLDRSWKLGINHFADMTNTEFKNLYLPSKFETVNSEEPEEPGRVYSYPSSVDWVKKGAVTSVKNQKQCGSCWSFSTVEGVEGAWALAGNILVSLSEQQLMDCSTSFGNQGCDGGLMTSGYEYVKKFGLTSFNNYPYTARDGQCNTAREKLRVATISKYTVVAPNKDALLEAASKQPVSVAVEANQLSWQFYFGGIVRFDCGTRLDHGVLVAGYNLDHSTPYWIVKNSWGSSWGESGYLKIEVSSGKGVCGINMSASYPTI